VLALLASVEIQADQSDLSFRLHRHADSRKWLRLVRATRACGWSHGRRCPPTSLTPQSLNEIVLALIRWVADRGTKNQATRPLIHFAWLRLRRLSAQFAILVAALLAGELPAAPSTRRRTCC
jgi:hypothetical protein